MKITEQHEAPLQVQLRSTWVWDAAKRQNVEVKHYATVQATFTTAEALGAWAITGGDAHLMTVRFADYTDPEPRAGRVAQTLRVSLASDSFCRDHHVHWRFFREDLNPHDRDTQDKVVSCEDCRRKLGLEQIKDPRHYVPLRERPVKPPTQKELKLAAFKAKFEAKYGQAPEHFESFQTTNNNTALYALKNLLAYPFGYNSPRSQEYPQDKVVTALMQAAGKVADLQGQDAMLRHVAELLGVDARWGSPTARSDDYFFHNGVRMIDLTVALQDEQIDALLKLGRA